MENARKNIVEGLRKELLLIQGCSRGLHNNTRIDETLGKMNSAFPNNSFPVSAVHEFICESPDLPATKAFITVLVAALMNKKNASLWITSSHSLFPPALEGLGIPPDKMIFIFLKSDNEVIWAMEEALKCPGLPAVIGELKELSFTASRRLQLAVEKSRVTGFVLRCNPRLLHANACVSRWQIKPLESELPGSMPGIGFPRWQVELQKIRNGQPGIWQIEYRDGNIRHVNNNVTIAFQHKKKAV